MLPTLTIDPSGRTSRDDSLNDRTTGITRSTPATGLQMRQLMLLAALIANARDHGALDAANNVRVVVEILDHPGNSLDFIFGGMRFHYDDQVINPLR